MARKPRDDRASRLLFALGTILKVPEALVAKELKISRATLQKWKTGRVLPRKASVDAIQKLLDKKTRTPKSSSDRARAIVARLHVEHGSPHLNNKRNPLDELFFILLSLKTSHRTYEDTYARFKRRFHPWSKLLRPSTGQVEQYIRSGGLGSIKARSFIHIARKLKKDFGSVTLRPLTWMSDTDALRYLISLPGVGTKTARCVAMYALGRPVLPVDTHTYRVGVRTGLIPISRSASDAHDSFDKAIDADLSYALHTNFVAHGRSTCGDPVPQCGACCVRKLCEVGKTSGATAAQVRLKREPDTGVAAALTKRKSDRPKRRKLVAVDLYAGSGGLSLGLKEAGFHVAYAVDWNKYACETHRRNSRNTVVECADIRRTSGKDIKQRVGRTIDLLAGGPNCQGLSQLGLRSPDDPRNFMLQEFGRLVSELRPRAFLLENVPGLAHRHNFPILRAVFDWFRKLGYRCAADVLLAADYGAPQLRYRLVLFGTRDPNMPLTLPKPTHSEKGAGGLKPYVTVRDAIKDLPAIKAGHTVEVSLVTDDGQQADAAFQRFVRRGRKSLFNHVCSETAEVNKKRIATIPAGGNWRDIPPELIPDRLLKCRVMDHSTTYGRLRWNQPSFTITALFGNVTAGAFTHPSQDRSLSIREGARLQTFPDKYRFFGPRSSQCTQIGNAVPPLLARAVGRHFAALLSKRNPSGIEPRITEALLHDERASDALPVLTPRFMSLFKSGTRWPKGWGAAPTKLTDKIDKHGKLKPRFRRLEMRVAPAVKYKEQA